jgi:hypothetical protein
MIGVKKNKSACDVGRTAVKVMVQKEKLTLSSSSPLSIDYYSSSF